MITITLTTEEMTLVLSAIGEVLADLSLTFPSGQPAPPQMVMLETLQAKLMKANGE